MFCYCWDEFTWRILGICVLSNNFPKPILTNTWSVLSCNNIHVSWYKAFNPVLTIALERVRFHYHQVELLADDNSAFSASSKCCRTNLIRSLYMTSMLSVYRSPNVIITAFRNGSSILWKGKEFIYTWI
jgi:hypothetical protein